MTTTVKSDDWGNRGDWWSWTSDVVTSGVEKDVSRNTLLLIGNSSLLSEAYLYGEGPDRAVSAIEVGVTVMRNQVPDYVLSNVAELSLDVIRGWRKVS